MIILLPDQLSSRSPDTCLSVQPFSLSALNISYYWSVYFCVLISLFSMAYCVVPL